MPRILLKDKLIKSLTADAQERSMYRLYDRDSAYETLKQLTGQDFGYNPDEWREWIDDQDDPFPNRKEVKLPKRK